jgi:hypothetical protein
LLALADALSPLRQDTPDVVAGTLRDRIASARLRTDRLLIVVDQAEELFSQPWRVTEAEAIRQFHADAEQFIRLLLAAAQGPTSLVLTIRSDFFDPLMHSPFAPLLKEAQVPLGRIADLHPCIERPAAVVGLRLAPGLADRIVDEVGAEESNLPLLQHALERHLAAATARTGADRGCLSGGGRCGGRDQPGGNGLLRDAIGQRTRCGAAPVSAPGTPRSGQRPCPRARHSAGRLAGAACDGHVRPAGPAPAFCGRAGGCAGGGGGARGAGPRLGDAARLGGGKPREAARARRGERLARRGGARRADPAGHRPVATGPRPAGGSHVAGYMRRSIEAADAAVQAARQRRRRLFGGVVVAAVFFAGLSAAAGWFWWQSTVQQRVAEAQRKSADEQRAIAEAQRARAETSAKVAQSAAQGVIFDIAEGLVDQQGIAAATVQHILDTALGVIDAMLNYSPDDAALRRLKWAALVDFADARPRYRRRLLRPTMPAGSATCRSATRRSAMCW